MKPHIAAIAMTVAVVGPMASSTLAQSVPPTNAMSITDDMPLADYLALLAQISPAAHAGAQAYLQAFQQRCGRPVRAAELRQAVADGEGDPVLMGMIRANHLRDAKALAQLGQRVTCERRSVR